MNGNVSILLSIPAGLLPYIPPTATASGVRSSSSDCIFSKGMVFSNAVYFEGENMEALSGSGVFFAGLGILLLSFGVFWFVSVYSKKK